MSDPAGYRAASPRLRRLRTIAVALLMVAGCVNYLDRAAVAVGNPEIRASLGLSYGEMGLLLSAFAWSYGLAQIPAGALVDRFGPRPILGAALALWSLAQLAAGTVTNLGQFIVARVALGTGESPMYLGGARVCADWFPRRARAVPIAVLNASSALAPALAPPLLTGLMIAFGWRMMFVIAGIAGLAVAAPWLMLYRNPGDAGVTTAELAEIRREDGAAIERDGLGRLAWLLRFRTSRGMILGYSGVVYVSWLYATWLPGYLETARHQSIAAAGMWSSVPLAAGFVGAMAGGFISAALVRRRIDAAAACRIPVVCGLVAAGACTLASAVVADTSSAIALMAGGLFAANVASSCGWIMPAVMAPPNTVASLEALQNVGGSVGGALAPYASGVLLERTGSFTPAFVLAGVIALACAIVYGLMTRDVITVASPDGRACIGGKDG